VYRGFNKVDGSEVAIKVLNIGPKEKLGSIENEIRMMRESKHPNVVAHKGTYVKDEKLWVCYGGALDGWWLLKCIADAIVIATTTTTTTTGCYGIYGWWCAYRGDFCVPNDRASNCCCL
jgi:hypothetical protein